MKNVKTKIMAALVATSVLIPTTFAYAENNATVSNTTTSITKQQKAAIKAQNQEERASLKEKRAIIKQNNETNSALRKEIKDKRATAKNIKKEIKDNNKVITADDQSKIEAERQIIEADMTTLESTKGTIKSEFEAAKAAIKSKNFTEAETHLDTIISIQKTRTESLKKLSADMDTLVNILQTASANATTKTS